jgi:hypothetical protein
MTKSKLEFATELASLLKDGSDPKKLAQDMTMRKLLYEIERLEQEAEAVKAAPEPEPVKAEPEARARQKGPKPFWAWLTVDSSDEDIE